MKVKSCQNYEYIPRVALNYMLPNLQQSLSARDQGSVRNQIIRVFTLGAFGIYFLHLLLLIKSSVICSTIVLGLLTLPYI